MTTNAIIAISMEHVDALLDPAEKEAFVDSITNALLSSDRLEIKHKGVVVGKLLSHRGFEVQNWPNGCDQTVPKALRYLAENPRPSYGESPFNSEHLHQLASEIEQAAQTFKLAEKK